MTHPQTQDDEALVEVMARAIYDDCWGWFDERQNIGSDDLLATARAALTALRNHEGRKG